MACTSAVPPTELMNSMTLSVRSGSSMIARRAR
jgi:hypothetical protein